MTVWIYEQGLTIFDLRRFFAIAQNDKPEILRGVYPELDSGLRMTPFDYAQGDILQ